MIASANKKTVVQLTMVVLLAVLTMTSLSACKNSNPLLSSIDTLPVQHEGRTKPFSAFANKVTQLVTSKSHFEKKSASHVVLDLLSDETLLASKKWIRVDFHPLKSALSLPLEEKYFSYNELYPKLQIIRTLASSAQKKRDSDQRPEKIEQKAQLILSRFATVYAMLNKTSLAVVPTASGSWDLIADHPIHDAYTALLSAWKDQDLEAVSLVVSQWHGLANQSVDSHVLNKNRMENLYLQHHPFQKAWILYLICALLFMGRPTKTRFKIASSLLLAAIIFHLLGLAIRVYVLGRPPVSNMYESMIFMGFVLMLAGTIFSMIYKTRFVIQAGAFGAAAILIYADLLPIDGSFGTLVPVLRSNYWLLIHVLTIVSSYGAYGLAMIIAHRHLWLHNKNTWDAAEMKKSGNLILRIIEVGTLLIAIGTILGGVWANESWGRFWGWDPKETWALITLLGYLIAIHLRYFNQIKEFGIALCAILGFLLVLMTWYGVNFVLGRGLHSYGSGSGGMHWIVMYIVFELLFLAIILFKKTTRKNASSITRL